MIAETIQRAKQCVQEFPSLKSESNIFITEFSKSNKAALFIQFPAYFANPEL